jgi:hypothetical protein
MRREAVAQLMATAARQTNGTKATAVTTYRQALGFSREADQIEDIAKRLQDLGDKVDLAKTFGWVSKWQLIGPFDNTGEAGFAKVYPPEERLDLGAGLTGKSGPVKWFPYETRSEYGLVDFNQAISSLKGAVGYATAEFWSDSARTAQVRLGCKNGWKVWVGRDRPVSHARFIEGRKEHPPRQMRPERTDARLGQRMGVPAPGHRRAGHPDRLHPLNPFLNLADRLTIHETLPPPDRVPHGGRLPRCRRLDPIPGSEWRRTFQ